MFTNKKCFFRFYILCENISKIGPIIKKIPKFWDDPLKKWVKMGKLFDFYGILKKDLWGAYEWTWDIVDFFVKSIHCLLLGDSKKFPKFQIVWRC